VGRSSPRNAWNIPTAAIQNANGKFVAPSEAAAAAAESDATMDPATNLVTFAANPNDATAYNSYLMVESYLVVPTSASRPPRRRSSRSTFDSSSGRKPSRTRRRWISSADIGDCGRRLEVATELDDESVASAAVTTTTSSGGSPPAHELDDLDIDDIDHGSGGGDECRDGVPEPGIRGRAQGLPRPVRRTSSRPSRWGRAGGPGCSRASRLRRLRRREVRQ